MEIAHYTPDDVRLVFPGEFGDDLTPEAIDKWAAGRFDEDGDLIDTHEPISTPTDAELAKRRAMEEISKRQMAFYDSMQRAGISPDADMQRSLDNLTNPYWPNANKTLDHDALVRRARNKMAQLERALTAHVTVRTLPANTPGPAKPEAIHYENERTIVIERLQDRLSKFVLPEYLWDGILVKRCCYALTAQTGAGKTAAAMLASVHVALGLSLCGRDVERGSVIYLAGENPTDVDMRWHGLCHHMGLNLADLDVHTIVGTMNIWENIEQIKVECASKNIEPALIVVDTAAAYFPGDNDNDNVQMGNYARQLRELCNLPGGPSVLVLCHPTKGAKEIGEMVPRGGGAFLNEVDGNLAAARTDGNLIGIKAVGKFRGPEFTPLHLGLHTVRDCPALFDPKKGTHMPTVVAQPVSEAGAAARAIERESMDVRLVRFIYEHPKVSFAQIAAELKTNKSAAERMVNHLIVEKQVKRDKLTGKLTLTSAAQMSLNELESEPNRSEAAMVPFPGIPGPRIP